MGPIVDRSLERLVSTDIAIVQARRRLLAAAEGMPNGAEPPALDPATHRVRSASFVAASDIPLSQIEEILEAKSGKAHTTI